VVQWDTVTPGCADVFVAATSTKLFRNPCSFCNPCAYGALLVPVGWCFPQRVDELHAARDHESRRSRDEAIEHSHDALLQRRPRQVSEEMTGVAYPL
jgi:hypothetical protein